MLSIARLLRRSGPSAAATRAPLVEPLESRQLLSTTPTLTGMHLVGPLKSVSEVVLTFNESLDPTTAQQPKSFVFGRQPPAGSNNGVTIGDVLGFLAKPKPKAVVDGKIQWTSASYDDATHSVTLTPVKPFSAAHFLRILRVKGTGQYAVKDLQGNVLNGGKDTVIHWSTHNGQSLRIVDSDGDVATIKLKGRGHLYGFYRKTGDPSPVIFTINTNAKSVLTGTVKQGRTGDGIVHVAQLLGAPANTNLLSSSGFVVSST
jgi:hypothetical protein